jgi:hypothetical protein
MQKKATNYLDETTMEKYKDYLKYRSNKCTQSSMGLIWIIFITNYLSELFFLELLSHPFSDTLHRY